jgi:DMSO/TMAO reductase YedYZ molybdopterin-dependent catalytic subunit
LTHLKFISENPPNAGTPLNVLDGSPLDARSVYLRNNFSPPAEPPSQIDVRIGERNSTLDPRDVARLPNVEIDMVLECAGNGRIYMDPVPDGTPWDLGGASPVTFAGPRLLDVLGRIPDDVIELIFTGADGGEVQPEGHINYQFSLGRDLWDQSILATSLAGQELPLEHGGPVRLVVPGHYAMKSVKWLTNIATATSPFTAHFINKYRYFGDSTEVEGAPVGSIRVRSLISRPSEGDLVSAGDVEFAGAAWSGAGRISKIEIAVDDETWMDVPFDRRSTGHGATMWSVSRTLGPGSHRISVRATDGEGNSQPTTPQWNVNGYGNNVIHSVKFDAR